MLIRSENKTVARVEEYWADKADYVIFNRTYVCMDSESIHNTMYPLCELNVNTYFHIHVLQEFLYIT